MTSHGLVAVRNGQAIPQTQVPEVSSADFRRATTPANQGCGRRRSASSRSVHADPPRIALDQSEFERDIWPRETIVASSP